MMETEVKGNVTFCIDCEAMIYEKQDPNGYKRDLCPIHYAEEVEAKEGKRYSRGIRASVVESKQKEFDRKTAFEWMIEFGVPQRAAEAADRHYLKRPNALDNYLALLPYESYNLYLHGPAGTGKTVLAAALLYHYARTLATGRMWNIAKGFYPEKFLFVNIPKTLDIIRKSYGNREWEKNGDLPGGGRIDGDKFTERMEKAQVLVLDDLGMDKATDWVLSTLFVIIDERYNRSKPTIFTSNLSLEDLSDRLKDTRISSRIENWCLVKSRTKTDFRKEGNK